MARACRWRRVVDRLLDVPRHVPRGPRRQRRAAWRGAVVALADETISVSGACRARRPRRGRTAGAHGGAGSRAARQPTAPPCTTRPPSGSTTSNRPRSTPAPSAAIGARPRRRRRGRGPLALQDVERPPAPAGSSSGRRSATASTTSVRWSPCATAWASRRSEPGTEPQSATWLNMCNTGPAGADVDAAHRGVRQV